MSDKKITCEICQGQYCPNYSITGPCLPIEIKEKEQENERRISKEHTISI